MVLAGGPTEAAIRRTPPRLEGVAVIDLSRRPLRRTVPDLGLVIPFYNEERAARAVATDALNALRGSGLDFELVLVADGSTDGTEAELKAVAQLDPRVRAVTGPRAQGYGAAVLHGFSLLTADVVGWTDGDGQVPGQAVVDLYAAMRHEGAAIGIGRRHGRRDGWLRIGLSRCYNGVTHLMIGHRLADINSKPKLLRRDLLAAIAPRSRDWFIDTEIVIGAQRRGAAMVRIPVPFLARQQGASKVRASVVSQYLSNLAAFRRRIRAERPQLSAGPVSAVAEVSMAFPAVPPPSREDA